MERITHELNDSEGDEWLIVRSTMFINILELILMGWYIITITTQKEDNPAFKTIPLKKNFVESSYYVPANKYNKDITFSSMIYLKLVCFLLLYFIVLPTSFYISHLIMSIITFFAKCNMFLTLFHYSQFLIQTQITFSLNHRLWITALLELFSYKIWIYSFSCCFNSVTRVTFLVAVTAWSLPKRYYEHDSVPALMVAFLPEGSLDKYSFLWWYSSLLMLHSLCIHVRQAFFHNSWFSGLLHCAVWWLDTMNCIFTTTGSSYFTSTPLFLKSTPGLLFQMIFSLTFISLQSFILDFDT